MEEELLKKQEENMNENSDLIKIYKLKKGENFEIEANEKILIGTFLGMDGMYAKVSIKDVSDFTFLGCATLVKKIDKN